MSGNGTEELIIARQDMYTTAFNYFYDGWKYREPTEGYAAVAKDCDEAAIRMVTNFERLIKEHYEDTRNQ